MIRTMNKEKLHDELAEHAPTLRGFDPKPDALRVPPGYFDTLEDSVFRQLEAVGAQRNRPAPQPAPSLWQVLQGLWQPRTALIAASVLAIGAAAWWMFRSATTRAPEYPVVTAEDIELYLLDNPMLLDVEQLAAALPHEQLPPVALDPAQPETGEQTIHLSPADLESLLRDMSESELNNLTL